MTDPTTQADAPLPAAPFTLADFEAANVKQLVHAHPELDMHDLGKIFMDARAKSTGQASEALKLLAGICSMMLVPEEPGDPYRPMVQWGDGTSSMALEHVSRDAAGALAQLVEQLDNAALRARIADVVWLRDRSKGRQVAIAAVRAYRELPIEVDTWHRYGRAGWHRALQLAKQIRAEDELAAIEAALLDAFFAAAGNPDYGYWALHLVRPLRSERRGGARFREVAEQLEAVGRHRLGMLHTFMAQDYFETAAEWYKWAGDQERQAVMLSLAADAIALQADQGDSAIIRHHWMTKAVEAYRRVSAQFRAELDVDAKIDALLVKRRVAGHAALGEMTAIPLPREDVTDEIQAAIAHVKGRPPFDALLAFCGLDSAPDVTALRDDAERTLQDSVLRTLMGASVMADDGRTVETSTVENGREGQLAAEMRAIFRRHAGKVALARLQPARDQLRIEQNYRLADFVTIAKHSPIVPADRAGIVGRGLYAGYCGEMVDAMHILMPQFEHIVRHVLQGAEALTAHHKDGLDMEVALASLLDRPQMAEEFGDGLKLAIHAIMCDRAGPNLRNDVAHGLVNEEACESAYALYAWWQVMQLVTETAAATAGTGDDESEIAIQDHHVNSDNPDQ
jgi:hypothetical protein